MSLLSFKNGCQNVLKDFLMPPFLPTILTFLPWTHLSGPKPAWMRVALYLWAAVSCPWPCEVCRMKNSLSLDGAAARGGGSG